jgi:5-methylcytosine-specific restriction endonuclease McrA
MENPLQLCERCRQARATVLHHKLRRSQGGGNDDENLARLCAPCHSNIHMHPEDSYREGWMVRGVQNVRKQVHLHHDQTDG